MSAARVGYLGLGSNVGDRRANLQSALDGLVARGVGVLGCSSTYDTDPVGEIRDQPAFLNAALRIEIEKDFVLPAVTRQPVAQGDRLGIVCARMA